MVFKSRIIKAWNAWQRKQESHLGFMEISNEEAFNPVLKKDVLLTRVQG